jgi:iodotyrosine deiodinase
MSKFIKLDFERLTLRKQKRRAQDFYRLMNTRRTVRHFSDEPVPFELIEAAVKTAGTAPSGANLQPWHFVVVRDLEVKKQIRLAAEREEYENYHGRMPDRWLKHLAPLGTNENKPYLETAPYLIAVFRTDYLINEETGKIEPTYYSQESVGIAVGILLAALHNVGLATLTHTPSPMRFLNEILERPKNERAYVLIPVGYPVENVEVPNIKRKPLDEIMKVI